MCCSTCKFTYFNTEQSETNMSDPFIGQIMMVGFNFAPQSWALCNGQLLPISQNTALFSLIGTNYGGDGRSTFGLPDLRGRAPIHQGQGPGLSARNMGQAGGIESVTLSQLEMPSHTHNANLNLNVSVTSALKASAGLGGGTATAAGNALGQIETIYSENTPDQTMDAASIDSTVTDGGSGVAVNPAGGSRPHQNMQPFQVVNFVICLYGIFPPRS